MKSDSSVKTSGELSAPLSKLTKVYDHDFVLTDEYRAAMPDMQNADSLQIFGANVPILKVGISNFRLPLRYITSSSDTLTLETSVTGTVSLEANQKGINMSRIMRVFYTFQERIMTPDLLQEILQEYKTEIRAHRAQLKLNFEYPILKPSLRSGLDGWQYYRCAFEGRIDELNRFRKYIHFDFIYSSACPCSSELSEHARESREIYGIPHSQRSTARVSVEVAESAHISIERIQELCLEALQTETQVMVKREDEQAFAEMNGAYTKFVEDAARLLYEQLDSESRIVDFQVACAHLESLHSHDAVAVINKGVPGGFTGHFDDFKSLIR
ncbi:MAG: GTP cyclohydrolase I FolE2 [Puniceicoccaceae bacterium]|nr:MAG: GTP cyclohydrolase I FolE2 [Puniceicoccaceae bacterium]